jgi:hypothetical protein
MGANVKSNPTRTYTSHQGTHPSKKALATIGMMGRPIEGT